MTQAYFVCDGGTLPAKATTIQKRTKALNAALKKAKTFKDELMKEGVLAGVRDEYEKLCHPCVGRKNWMEAGLVRMFEQQSTASLVLTSEKAVFESDAQIGHLFRLVLFDFAIVNDQDIPMYGALRCVFNLLGQNRQAGYALDECDILDITSWTGAMPPCGRIACTQSVTGKCVWCGIACGLDRYAVLQAYSLSGCDYTPGIGGVTITTACDYIRSHITIGAAVQALRSSGIGKFKVLKG
jgi:hypothetical protein